MFCILITKICTIFVNLVIMPMVFIVTFERCENTSVSDQDILAQEGMVFLNFKPQVTEDIVIRLIEMARQSIEISLYGFDNQRIADALIDVHKRGRVKIRISSEFDSETSLAWQKIIKHRIPIRFGNSGGIMHNKYIIVDRKYVLTGSSNLTKGLANHFNHIVIFNSPSLSMEYLQDFEIQFAGYYAAQKDTGFDRVIGGLYENSNLFYWQSQTHNFLGNISLRAYFTPYKSTFLEYTSNPDFSLPLCESHSCLRRPTYGNSICAVQSCLDYSCYVDSSRGRNKILYAYPNYDDFGHLYCTEYDNAMNIVISLVQRAQVSILILAFSFRDRVLMYELIRAQQERNVDVKIWTDERQYRAAYQDAHKSFQTLSEQISLLKIVRKPDGGLLHHKVIVIDKNVILLGSLNFSSNAVNSNDENFVIIENAPALSRAFYQEATRIDKYSHPL